MKHFVLATGADEIDSPHAKRQCSKLLLGDDSARMCSSQPLFAHQDQLENARDAIEARLDYCFSQPTLLDDMLLCTQLNATQGSSTQNQNQFQRLVKRMTRFFVDTKCQQTINRLTTAAEKLGYTWKLNDGDSIVTIYTVDSRKVQLTFKAQLLEMDGKILLDFRLSKGCGLEFKRIFVKLKTSLSDIIEKSPITWPLSTLPA